MQGVVVAGVGGLTITINCLDSSTDGTILEGAQLTATAANNVVGTTILKPTKAKVGSPTPHH